MTSPAAREPPTAPRKFQFTLQHLLILTATLAVTFGVLNSRVGTTIWVVLGVIFLVVVALVERAGWSRSTLLIPLPPVLVLLILAPSEVREFSPETLKVRTQREWRLLGIPLASSGSQLYRPELVEYLVAEGYWQPTHARSPRWIARVDVASTSSWHLESHPLHEEFAESQFWITWTEEHPELAAEVWPTVHQVLQQNQYPAFLAADVMRIGLTSRTPEEFWNRIDQAAGLQPLLPLKPATSKRRFRQ